MSQPLKDYTNQCLEIVADALITHETFNSIRTPANRKKYATFKTHPAFWSAINGSVFTVLILDLYKILERRTDSINVGELINWARREKIITNDEKKAYALRINAMEVVWRKVQVLRNKIMAHTCKTTTIAKAFADASVTPKELEQLGLECGALINEIARKLGIKELDLDGCTEAIDIQTEQILEKLNQK